MSISQRVDNILNGVSQQPPALRHPSEATEQINALALPSRGVSIRPPTKHVSQLASVAMGAPHYFVHRFRTPTTHYVVVISNGTIKVFDETTGAEYPVTINDAAYLSGSDFRAATSDGVTYIINRDKVVSAGLTKAPSALNDALIYVRQVDYSTTYTVTITENIANLPSRLTGKKTGTASATVSYTTPDGTDPKARAGITTDNIALSLFAELQANSYIATYYTLELIGSSIYVARPDGTPFAVQADDGLADKGINVIKGSVQSFDDLPARAKNGFVVEVVGDDASDFGRYWVMYDDTQGGVGRGVWNECPKPGSLIEIDASTLPHKLVLGGEYLSATVGQLPPPPTVTDESGTEIEVGPTHGGITPPIDTTPTIPLDGPTIPDTDTQATDHGGFVAWNPPDIVTWPSDPTGNELSLSYHIDTSVMDPNTRVRLSLIQMPAGGVGTPTVLAEAEHEAGQTLKDQTLSATNVNLTGAPIVVQQTYFTGETPVVPFRKAVLTVPGV